MRRLNWFIPALLLVVAASRGVSAHPGPGIVVAMDGTIYFVVGPNHCIYRIRPGESVVPWITGALDSPFRVPHHLVLERDGSLVTASDAGSLVWRITPDGKRTRIYPPREWDGRATVGLGGQPFTIDAHGRLIALASLPDGSRRSIVRIDPSGRATLLAGGAPGFADGRHGEARFGDLRGAAFALGLDGTLYLTDDGRRVRRVSPEGGVWTIAGGADAASIDGSGAEARFNGATGLAVAPDGTIYVAESRGRRIRRISSDGLVSTLAGTGDRGGCDGPGSGATFEEPVGVALDPGGDVIVLEYGRTATADFVRLRRIGASGTVSTIGRIDVD